MTGSHLTSVLVLLISCGAFADVSPEQKVNVSVYYEALCPDSIAFIRGSMWTAYQDVPELMNLELVPYGKARYERKPDGSIKFSCQHGPDECLGNLVQACILNVAPVDKRVELIKCVMSRRRPQAAGPACAASLGLPYSELDACVTGSAGQQYLLAMGQKTESLQPKLSFVPWININGAHSDEKQEEALFNLKSVVCSSFSGASKPAKCSS